MEAVNPSELVKVAELEFRYGAEAFEAQAADMQEQYNKHQEEKNWNNADKRENY